MNTHQDQVEAFIARLEQVGSDREPFVGQSIFDSIRHITSDVEEFVKLWRGDGPMDFVHDFRTGFFFVDMYACHQVVMRLLLEAHTHTDHYDTDQAADTYIERGMGVFRSSQSHRVWYSPAANIPLGLKYLWRRDLMLL